MGWAIDTRRIDYALLGAVAGIDNGTRGTEYFDAFEAHRKTGIGLASDAVPTASLEKLDALFADGFESGNLKWDDFDASWASLVDSMDPMSPGGHVRWAMSVR